MVSSDIYELKDPPWAKKKESVVSQKRRRSRHHGKTFDEAVNPELPKTHRRRSRNSGTRRFQHLMKNPEFSKKFWLTTLGTAGAILALLIVWDLFFRYPGAEQKHTPQIYRAVVE